MKKIKIQAAGGAYEVLFGRGLLAQASSAVARLGGDAPVFLLSSPRVWSFWGKQIETSFGARRANILFANILFAKILFDDAESAKNLGTVEGICRDLVRAGADRRALLVAVGGGVVGDVAGFAAASYARGVGLVHIPTTLVAQVDSAVGGKTGVNLPEGKNLVGAFYPPRLVLADPGLLKTLPLREFRSGIYEILKYGVIGDARLFAFLEQNLEKLLRREPAAVDFVIERSIRQKARVVSRDEHEAGLREILNFGHTFAHALESVTRYRQYLHGEAVAWGMMAATRLAMALEMIREADAERVLRLVKRVGTLPPWPRAGPARLVAAMQSDKKTRDGKLRFVLPEAIGVVRCGVAADEKLLLGVLRECGAIDGVPDQRT